MYYTIVIFLLRHCTVNSKFLLKFGAAKTGAEASMAFICSIAFWHSIDHLKGLAQAKIIKKSVILFRVFNMTI